MQYMQHNAPINTEDKMKRQLEREEREAEIRMKNNRLGITIFQMSWIMVFICLIVVYWQMGFRPGWRPTPEQAPNPIWPTLATLGLIASGFFSHRAMTLARRAKSDDARAIQRFLQQWLLAIGLGALFFVVMMAQYFAIPVDNEGQQFGYIYKLMIGYHAVHAIVIGIMMVQVWRLGKSGRYHQEHNWPVEAAMRLWDFVVVAWLLFYAVLYVPFLF